MTPEQRYLFDVFGYLLIENALSPEELKACQEASERYMNTPEDQLPPGFGIDGKRHLHGFAFDKSLEARCRHVGDGAGSIIKLCWHRYQCQAHPAYVGTAKERRTNRHKGNPYGLEWLDLDGRIGPSRCGLYPANFA